MFFIIWRGWGFLVIPLAIAAGIAGIGAGLILERAGLAADLRYRICAAVSGAAGAALIWFVARALEGGPTRRLVDSDSGRQYVIRRSAGSLFFIPTRYWAFIVLALGLLGSALGSAAPRTTADMSQDDVSASASGAGL